MKALLAFINKELNEQLRSGKLALILILYILFGIMNPAVAKLTPWILEMMADSFAQTGITVTDITVTALDSWMQLFKNAPIMLIAFILLESSIFTKEYQSGTLLLTLTKGLSRYKVVISKAAVLCVLWTVGYWLCFAVTYAYNAFYWDNSVVRNLLFAAFCLWLFGIWTLALTVLFSAAFRSNTAVLTGTGAAVLLSYIISILPKAKKYLPTFLIEGNSLIFGKVNTDLYQTAIIFAAAAAVICFAVSIPIFNKKQL